jgi:hypothetical protein
VTAEAHVELQDAVVKERAVALVEQVDAAAASKNVFLFFYS